MVFQNLESWQTRKRSKRGGAKCWKESYITGVSVLIGGKVWYLDVKDNPSWGFFGFTLPYPRLTPFLKSIFSWWNPKTRWEWIISSLIYVFKVFGPSLMWMVWGTFYPTPKHEPTGFSGLRMAISCFCQLNLYFC